MTLLIGTLLIITVVTIGCSTIVIVILSMEGNLMATIEEAKQAFEQYRDDVRAKVADLGTKIDALTAKLAGSTEGADLDSLVTEVNAAKNDLDGAVASPPTLP